MVEGGDLNSIDARIAAVHRAIRQRDLLSLKLSLEGPGQAAVANGMIDSVTPLNHAIHGSFVEAVRLLLQGGADPNRVDENEQAPLHYAVIGEQGVALTQLLLSHGADVNTPTTHGLTPLDLAMAFENTDVCRCLEHAGGWSGRQRRSGRGIGES